MRISLLYHCSATLFAGAILCFLAVETQAQQSRHADWWQVIQSKLPAGLAQCQAAANGQGFDRGALLAQGYKKVAFSNKAASFYYGRARINFLNKNAPAHIAFRPVGGLNFRKRFGCEIHLPAHGLGAQSLFDYIDKYFVKLGYKSSSGGGPALKYLTKGNLRLQLSWRFGPRVNTTPPGSIIEIVRLD